MIEVSKKISWRKIWVLTISFLVILGIVYGGFISYASTYETRVLPGVYVGELPVGGMSREELKTFLEEMNDKLNDAGITLMFEYGGKAQSVRVNTTILSEENIVEFISMDAEKEADILLSYQKKGNLFVRAWSAILTRIAEPHLNLTTVTLNKDLLMERVASTLESFTVQPKEAGVTIVSLDPFLYTVASSSVGVTFVYDDIIGKIISAWNALRVPEIFVTYSVKEPMILDDEVLNIVGRLANVFDLGSLDVTYTDPHTRYDYTWTITRENIASWIEVQRHEEGVGFGLSMSSTSAYIVGVIGDTVNREAQDARFQIGNNGKVAEFRGSRPGIVVDIESTYKAINSAIISRSWHNEGVSKSVQVIVSQVEPKVKTSEINDLGISDILGIGFSNFSGSPANRIKNIRHAVVNKLNGLLIKPDEEFSLLRALEPFTLEDGYLPELVIKGDEIKPEIAGGLCQIGTTIFRAVMNSGLPVTQRQNHSLVVNYYNDHRNGKPGTDATIYDPSPDFRFKNDTGYYILLATDMDIKTGDLVFTFWGTNDGRKGYYSEPVVHKWIPVGSEQIIKTTNLQPGEKNCQSAHTGAETSFTYTRVLPSGKEIKQVFSSYYRPLPKICLVGVEKTEKKQEDATQVCEFLPDGNVICETSAEAPKESKELEPTTELSLPLESNE